MGNFGSRWGEGIWDLFFLLKKVVGMEGEGGVVHHWFRGLW